MSIVHGEFLRASIGSTEQVVTFASSAAANTQKTISVAKPNRPVREYAVIVVNPSSVSDLTVKCFNWESSIAGSSQKVYLTSFSVPKKQTITGTTVSAYQKNVRGLFTGAAAEFRLSNDTKLTLAAVNVSLLTREI